MRSADDRSLHKPGAPPPPVLLAGSSLGTTDWGIGIFCLIEDLFAPAGQLTLLMLGSGVGKQARYPQVFSKVNSLPEQPTIIFSTNSSLLYFIALGNLVAPHSGQ
jgi:hypothetical protein